MSSFFDDDDEGQYPAGQAQAGSSRAGSVAPRSFLTRLSSMAGTPAPGLYGESVLDGATDAGGAGGPMDAEPAPEPSSIFSTADISPGAEEETLDDVRRLSRCWVRERGVPGLLRWEGELLDSLLDRLEQQVSWAGRDGVAMGGSADHE